MFRYDGASGNASFKQSVLPIVHITDVLYCLFTLGYIYKPKTTINQGINLRGL